MQLFLIGDGLPFWLCPLRRAHTTCTLVVDLGSPSPFLLCVAPRLYLITIFEVSIGTNSSTAITDKSVTLIPSSIHHCNFHLVNTTFCLLFNDPFAISPMVMFLLSFFGCENREVSTNFLLLFLFDGVAFIQFWRCESRSVNRPPCRFMAYVGFPNLLSFLVIGCSLHSWSPHFGDNMHHSLGDSLSLRSCLLGCIDNQLPLTVFDEFHFVKVSFRIPARAAGLLVAFYF